MGIIEKLGRRTPDELILVKDCWKVYQLAGLDRPNVSSGVLFENSKIIKKILDDRNELLEALIPIEKYTCKKVCHEEYQKEICGSCSHAENKRIIESQTGLSWEKVKELL